MRRMGSSWLIVKDIQDRRTFNEGRELRDWDFARMFIAKIGFKGDYIKRTVSGENSRD